MGKEKTDIKDFTNLTAWQKAHELVLNIYKLTRNYPREELYGVVSQLRRAASSITANIAEGFDRYHFKDKIRFYYQSRGSLSEVRNFIILSKDLGFIDERDLLNTMDLSKNVGQLLNGLIKATERQLENRNP